MNGMFPQDVALRTQPDGQPIFFRLFPVGSSEYMVSVKYCVPDPLPLLFAKKAFARFLDKYAVHFMPPVLSASFARSVSYLNSSLDIHEANVWFPCSGMIKICLVSFQ